MIRSGGQLSLTRLVFFYPTIDYSAFTGKQKLASVHSSANWFCPSAPFEVKICPCQVGETLHRVLLWDPAILKRYFFIVVQSQFTQAEPEANSSRWVYPIKNGRLSHTSMIWSKKQAEVPCQPSGFQIGLLSEAALLLLTFSKSAVAIQRNRSVPARMLSACCLTV